MQDTGAFKLRGAANAILRARETRAVTHLVAASSGNHGRAVAYVAQRLGIPSTICMTTLVPGDKVASIREFGAETVLEGDNQNIAVERALALAGAPGAFYVPPFDHPDVIAGQGTVALEMLQTCPDLDALIVPVSGGGLMSGMAVAARHLCPSIRIIGATSERDSAIYESIKAGRVVDVLERPSIADALPGPIPLDNRYTFAICRDLVDEIVPIPEASIARAMKYMLIEEKMVVEGAGVAGLAYALDHVAQLEHQTVGIVLSGSNISFARLWEVIAQIP